MEGGRAVITADQLARVVAETTDLHASIDHLGFLRSRGKLPVCLECRPFIDSFALVSVLALPAKQVVREYQL